MIPTILLEKVTEYLLNHYLDDAVELGKELLEHIEQVGESPNDGSE